VPASNDRLTLVDGLTRPQQLKAHLGSNLCRGDSPIEADIPALRRTANVEGDPHSDSLRHDRAVDQRLTYRDDTQLRVFQEPKDREREPPRCVCYLGIPHILETAQKRGNNYL